MIRSQFRFPMLGMVLAATLVAATGVFGQEVRRGGTLNLVAPYGSSLSSLDIHTTVRAQDDIVARSMHRSLYAWDSAGGKPELELAKSVDVSPDGRILTYKLRDNVFFHNGRRLTADDIIWSYTRVVSPKKGYPGARYIRIIEGAVDVENGKAEAISGLRKIDDLTLQMTLAERVDAGFHLYQGVTSILPREEVEKGDAFAKAPVGLGPFKLAEYVPGSHLAATRFDKYYKPGLPYLDKVVYQIMGEASARDIAFRGKQIDVNLLDSAQYTAYLQDAVLSKNLVEVAEAYTRHMGLNPRFKPFQDRRVRKAINHAINSQLIIERFVKNKAYRATGWLPNSSPAYDQNAVGYAFDPEKAKELLREAGYPDGFEVEVITNESPSFGRPILEAVIPFLSRVGIKVKIKIVENAVFQDLVFKQSEFDAYLYSTSAGPDALGTLSCFHSKTPHSACNYVDFADPAYDALIDAARKTSGPEQLALLKKANAYLIEAAPVWFFNYNKAVMAHQPWVRGIQPNATELGLQNPEAMWITKDSPRAGTP